MRLPSSIAHNIRIYQNNKTINKSTLTERPDGIQLTPHCVQGTERLFWEKRCIQQKDVWQAWQEIQTFAASLTTALATSKKRAWGILPDAVATVGNRC